jgi:hypothetical protein
MPEDKTLEDKSPEDKTPEGRPRKDRPASEGITALAESFDKVAKSLAAAALIFLIVFGCCYKWGEDHGQEAGKQIRLHMGEPILKTLAKEGAVLFWKDDKIIQGGLYGFLTIALLLSYVFIMFYFGKPDRRNWGEWTARKLRYPNILSAGGVFFLCLNCFLDRVNLADATALVVSVVLALCSWRWQSRLGLQITLLVCQALLLSFAYGENRGIESTDFQKNYPLVKVTDTNGTPTADLRLLGSDDSEYRFVDCQGQEQMIPKTQIRSIMVLPDSAPKPKEDPVTHECKLPTP